MCETGSRFLCAFWFLRHIVLVCHGASADVGKQHVLKVKILNGHLSCTRLVCFLDITYILMSCHVELKVQWRKTPLGLLLYKLRRNSRRLLSVWRHYKQFAGNKYAKMLLTYFWWTLELKTAAVTWCPRNICSGVACPADYSIFSREWTGPPAGSERIRVATEWTLPAPAQTAFWATTIVAGSLAKGQGYQGPLMLTHIVRHIFRIARPTNFKLSIRVEDDDAHQPQAPWPPRSRSQSHVISFESCWPNVP